MDDRGDRIATRYARYYLWIAIPTCIALAVLIGPFGVADEPAHFLRAVALSEGHVLPRLSTQAGHGSDPDGRSAGAPVDGAAADLAQAYDVSSARIDLTARPSIAVLKERLAVAPSGEARYAAHSNTAIYPPLLYPAATVATLLGRTTHLPVLLWFYLARIFTAAFGITIAWWAIRRSRDKAPVFLALATLPAVMFTMAGVAADGLLLPTFLLFGALIGRCSAKAPLTRMDVGLMGLASILVAAGKVAYLPLVLLAPLSALIAEGRLSRRAIFLLCSAAAGIMLWSIWTWLVHDKVFSIREGVVVDPALQLHHLLERPGAAITFFLREIAVATPKLVLDVGGRFLGWREILLPIWFAPMTLATIAIASLLAPETADRSKFLFATAAILAAGCYVLTFVLLYAQYNAVDATTIKGVQGRYLIPLAIILASLLPRVRVPENWTQATPMIVMAWSIVSAGMTLWVTIERYWL